MIQIFTIIVLLLLFLIYVVLKKNVQLKKQHLNKIKLLKDTMYSLNLKQKELNDKILISNYFDANFKNDFKTIGSEIVSLQEFFLDIISEKK